MTENQQKRLNELRSYLTTQRSNAYPQTEDNKQLREICTNGLAWIILIEDDE